MCAAGAETAAGGRIRGRERSGRSGGNRCSASEARFGTMRTHAGATLVRQAVTRVGWGRCRRRRSRRRRSRRRHGGGPGGRGPGGAAYSFGGGGDGRGQMSARRPENGGVARVFVPSTATAIRAITARPNKHGAARSGIAKRRQSEPNAVRLLKKSAFGLMTDIAKARRTT